MTLKGAFLLRFYSSESCHYQSTQRFGGLFGARPEIFVPLKQVNLKFGFLVKHFATFFMFFFVSDFLKNRIQPFA